MQMSFWEWLKSLFTSKPAAVNPVVVPIKPEVPMNQMPWMDFMKKHIGEHELAGAKADNPFIVAMFKHTNYKTSHDETPWCAACVCTALEENGYKSTHDASAISFAHYGDACELKPGCIVVIEHASGGHHVTFCDHIISHNPLTVACLGGNQSDSLKISNYVFANGEKIIATRWPRK
jgi:uncharacterized protein (TIGR02594 family)